jgi:hypothetical protein
VKVAALGNLPAAPVALGNLIRAARLDAVGSGACHVEAPLKVSAVRGFDLAPAATLNGAMANAFAKWAGPVDQAARAELGSGIERIIIAGSYDCRRMNHKRRARMSEHSRANAVDVAGFVLADGRRVTVKSDWKGSGAERAFWRSVHRTTCDVFSVVLGPGSDGYHEDHLHMDLARWKVCR